MQKKLWKLGKEIKNETKVENKLYYQKEWNCSLKENVKF